MGKLTSGIVTIVVELVHNSLNSLSVRYKDISNQVSVQAIVSNSLNEKETKELKDKLDKALGKDADLSINVDASIIGGIKLRVENTFLDASLKSQIKNIKLDLMKI